MKGNAVEEEYAFDSDVGYITLTFSGHVGDILFIIIISSFCYYWSLSFTSHIFSLSCFISYFFWIFSSGNLALMMTAKIGRRWGHFSDSVVK